MAGYVPFYVVSGLGHVPAASTTLKLDSSPSLLASLEGFASALENVPSILSAQIASFQGSPAVTALAGLGFACIIYVWVAERGAHRQPSLPDAQIAGDSDEDEDSSDGEV